MVPASAEERRYFVLDVSEERLKDFVYFKAILKQMKDGGRAAMLFDLMKVNLSGFQVRDVPETEGGAKQKDRVIDRRRKVVDGPAAQGPDTAVARWLGDG